MKLSDVNKAHDQVRRAQQILAALDRTVAIETNLVNEYDELEFSGELGIVEDPTVVSAIKALHRKEAEIALAEAKAVLDRAGIEIDEIEDDEDMDECLEAAE